MVVPFPAKCGTCKKDERIFFGCGCSNGTPWTESATGSGYIGKGKDIPEWGSDVEPYSKTCNQYYRNSPFVSSILEDVDDYKNNRFGNVLDLPAPMAIYLKIAASELQAWENNQMDHLVDSAS